MKRTAIFLFLIIQCLVISSFVQASPTSNGLSYLSSTQNPDGSWGSRTSKKELLPSTVSVIETFQLLSQTNTAQYSYAKLWLQNQALETTDYLSERIHSLTVAGADRDMLLLYIDQLAHAWGGYGDYEVNNFDTAFALLALKAVSYSDQNVISSALSYLTGAQNLDGGWGFAQGDDSNVYMTTVVLNTLSQFKSTYNLQTPITNAVAYLLTKQNADGGFGSSPSTVYETALAFEALLASGAVGADKASNMQNAISYITSTQLPNGSWNDDPYSTALALRVLGEAKPNLSIAAADITYSPSVPATGDIVTITATVRNNGRADASGITVTFYDGDPGAGGLLIGERTIASILQNGAGTASIDWTAPSSGIRNIYVLVDRMNTINEGSETDNAAVAQIRVFDKTDLAVQGMTFTPDLPSPGQPVVVQVTVSNTGGTAATNVLVRLDVDAAVAGEPVISSLQNLQSVILSFTLRNLSVGTHIITVTVDPGNAIPEGNKANNTLTRSLEVKERIDLVADSLDIFFSIADPKEGETLQISASISNTGTTAASSVAVRFYDGNPASGGVQIGVDQVIPSIPAGGKAPTGWVSYDTFGKPGLHHVYVVADPLNVISETDETNNTAIKAFTVTARTDIAVQDIQFVPAAPEEGDLVTIKAVVKNISQVNSAGTKLKFFLGAPTTGEQIGADQVVRYLYPGQTDTTGGIFPVTFNSAEKVGDNLIYAVLDPYNEVDEISKTNNTLSKTLTVRPSSRPDLTLTSSDIAFSPARPIMGDAVTISAAVKNLRDIPASNVEVRFFDGNPAVGGANIGSATIPNVPALGTGVAQALWNPAGLKGRREIYVRVDPANLIPEANELNNEAYAALKIRLPQGAAPVNLNATALNATDIGLTWQPGPEAAAYGIVGYNIYRNESQVNISRNIAKEGTPSASSSSTAFPPSYAIDGSLTTGWCAPSNTAMPIWWQDSFSAQRKIKKIAVRWSSGYHAKDFQIQTWDGAQWVSHASVTGNTSALFVYEFPVSVLTDKVRLYVTAVNNAYYPSWLSEVDIHEDTLVAELSYQDRNLPSGGYVYYVTAVDGGGAESLPSGVATASLGDATPPAAPTGLTATVSGFNVSLSWNANTEPDLAGYRVYRDGLNVAHKDRGAFAFSNGFDSVDGLIDGVAGSWVQVHWDTNPAGNMTVVLSKIYSINKLRMLLPDSTNNRFYRYFIESSLDGRAWQTIIDRTTGEWNGWQEFSFTQPLQARYFRITGTLCSTEALFTAYEFEAYSPDLAPKTLDTTLNLSMLSVDKYNYNNFYQYTYDWSSGSRQPRRFAFSQFSTEDKDILSITDKDSGTLLASYSGDLGPFWTPFLTATNYRFYFAADYEGTASGFKAIKYLTVGKQTARTFSETIYDGDAYRYAVTAVDTSGNESPLSSIVIANVSDTTPPATPKNLLAKGGNMTVDLTWSANTESDLGGYNLYRNGGATPLNGQTLLSSTSYKDLDVTNLTTYTYQITAVDINGNESPKSVVVAATPSGVDLAVEALSYSPFPAQRNEAVEISVSVRNKGNQDCPGSFTVTFYKGLVASGTPIATNTVTAVAAGQTAVTTASWAPTEFISDILVVIDRENAIPEYDETNNQATLKVVAFENRRTLYATYTHTLKDLVLFGYKNSTELGVFEADKSYVWAGTLNDGTHKVLTPGAGVYKVYGSMPYSILSGDPVSGQVMGYYALNEKNTGLSRNFYTYMVSFWGEGCKFIVFAYEDNTEVTVLNSDTGVIIWQGVLNKGGHYENGVERDVSGKFLRVVSSKPVSALSYTDQGYFIPSENGTFFGKLFYTYAGFVGNWNEDLNVIAFQDNTRVTITNTVTGQVFWQGTLNGGDFYSDHIEGYYTVEADKKVVAGVLPYKSQPYGYYHMAVPYDPTGTGVGKLFYALAQGVFREIGALHIFSYKDENHVKVTDWLAKTVVWEGTLYEGEYKRIDTVHTLYRVESSQNITLIEGYGSVAGADFIPTYYAAVTDLEATAVDLAPAEIFPGDNTLISARVSNLGDTNQDNVVVDIYVDDVKISSSTLNLPNHSVSLVEANWRATEGNHTIKVVVDPLDSVPEQNELNNVVSLSRTISPPVLPALTPELSIIPSGITFSRELPFRGETVTVSASIQNKGTDASNVLVLMYLGNPRSGGIQTGTSVLQSIPANASAIAQTAWTPDRTTGTYDICIWIDPYNSIPEGNKTDNIACRAVTVREKKITVDVSTDKAQYQANSNAGITVRLSNLDAVSWTGTGEVLIEDTSGNTVSHVATFTVDSLPSVGLAGWAYRIPVPVVAQRNLQDVLAETRVDFLPLLQALGMPGAHVDQNSLRVVEFGPSGSLVGEKRSKASFETAAVAKVLWLVDGTTAAGATRSFFVYFDVTENGVKAPSSLGKPPTAGKLIAYSDDGGKVFLVRNNGDGTFGKPVFVDNVGVAGGFSYTKGIVLDDFNNDGFLDIVTGSGTKGELYYYQNRADGTDTFLPKTTVGTIVTAGNQTLYAIASADFNNDGNRDFVASSSAALLSLYLGNGNGTFTQSVLPMPSQSVFVYGKAAADVDGDGNADLIVGTSAGTIYLYKGKGDGTFQPPVQIGNIGGGYIYGLTARDFDNDGKIDIIAEKRSTTTISYFLKGKGDGTFGAPTVIQSLGDLNTDTAFDAGDLNGDGNCDLLTATWYGKTIDFYPGNGDGTFGLKTNITVTIANTPDYPLGISASRALAEVHPSPGIPEAMPSRLFSFLWNTGSTLPGNYKVHVTLSEGQGVMSDGLASFAILADASIGSNVVVDKVSYRPNEQVTITSSVTNQSANAIFENLTARVSLASPGGQVLYTDTKPIPVLVPGQLVEMRSYWNTAANPPGVYPVTLTVTDGTGAVLSARSTSLTISGDLSPSALLRGQISVDRQSLLQGEPVNITYSVTNIGNMDLPAIALSIKTVHVVQQTVYDTLTDQTGLIMGQTYTNTKRLSTSRYTAKDYLVVLRASISGPEETLAGTYFRVEGAPSAPSLNSPQHGQDVLTPTPVLIVNNASDPNDDKLTYEFELYSDGSLTTLVASLAAIPEGTNVTSWQVPITLQENATYYWRARAYDGLLYGDWMLPAAFRVNVTNDPPTAPTLSSPAQNANVGSLTPVLTVNNATDPDSASLTYNFDLALDANFTQIVASTVGVFEGAGNTSWQVPVTLSDNTYYFWRAQADDWLTTGPWMTTARFFVNTVNDPPTAPVIVSPLNNSEVTALAADIVAANSTDPDSTVITYAFELDTVDTFDSPGIVRSGTLPEGQGTTAWRVTGLTDHTLYYTRAKASDGLAESPWSQVVSFFVNTANEVPTTPLLANPSDGGAVKVFTPTLSVHNSSDPDRDTLTYEFELYGNAAMTSRVASGSNIPETPQITSWTVPVTLMENNFYYWRARAFDGQLYSGWMPLASFMVNTANDAPGAPALYSPSNGMSLGTLTPVLSITNAVDPDSDALTYDFEIYSGGVAVRTIAGVPQNASGITSLALTQALSDNTTYAWRARAYDGDRYGAWMDMATFSIHLPSTNITATIDFDPNTLNKKSSGKWVVVYIELPSGYNVADINISSIRLGGTIPAETWPYAIGDYDRDGVPDLMVKFNRSAVINLLPNGDNIPVHVTGTVGATTFEGVDWIRVIP